MSEWKSTACILCECNCGIEVQLGGADGRHLVKVGGDDAHPASRGYACEKPSRLDFSLPNGLGLDFPDASGGRVGTGVSPNELTRSEDRDWVAGTPWHKHTPARVEAL